jgi:17beta-estradiol 17-dehydrogenase / very-long-chain 3-oxoacyl-CoA reductase
MPSVLELIGLGYLAYLGLSFLVAVSVFFKARKPSIAMGKWAVVTGASDGIGKEFCLQLAQQQFNIVLLARTEEKLQAVAKDCEDWGVETLVVPFDFSLDDTKAWTALGKSLSKLDIGVLVNNVGVSHAFPVPFIEEDEAMITKIMQVNVISLMKMTRLVLPSMIAKKKGLVLNIGSMSGKVPSALIAAYGASKAFVRSFSQALSFEVPRGVHIEHVNPYFVATAMSKIRKATLLAPTPKTFVKSILSNAGSKISSTPYGWHSLGEWIMDTFLFESTILSTSYAMHKDIRKRALAKQARQKAQ